MRFESSVTSISWIPSETVTGVNKAIFGTGFTHYDDPPPDVLHDVHKLHESDGFRFANVLSAHVEVEDGRIVDARYTGGCLMGSTTVGLGISEATFAAVEFPDIQTPVEMTDTYARFTQTTGGHTALPAPRRVKQAPFVAFDAPTVWTTLALTIYADGRSEYEVMGASAFPRHWVYDHKDLSAKVGLADFKEWWTTSFGKHTPWGDEDSPALVTTVETSLERELSTHIMRGGEKPSFRTVKKGKCLTEQGEEGNHIFLLLNGVVEVDCDGIILAELGPGAVLGERAALEDGLRTATLRALTKVKVAVITPDQIDQEKIIELRESHAREDQLDSAQ